MYFGLEIIDIIVIMAYFLWMIYIGVRSMKHIKNQEDYFLGGRKFGKLIQTFSAFGQGTSSDTAVGTTTTTFNNGASGIWSSLLAIWATPMYWFTSPWYRRMRVLTMGDFFEERYGSKSMAAFYSVITSVFLMSVIAIGTKAMSLTVIGMTQKDRTEFTQAEAAEYESAVELEKFRNLKAAGRLDSEMEKRFRQLEIQKPRKEFSHINEGVLNISIGLVVFIYMVAGGLEAAMYTDLIQGIFILILAVILVPFGLHRVNTVYDSSGVFGAINAIHQQLPESYFDIFGSATTMDFTWYYIVAVGILGTINVVVQPNMMNTLGSAKDEFAARIGFTIGNFMKRFCIVMWGVTGLIAVALYSGKISNSDYVWGHATQDLLGGLHMGLVGLVIACLMAALMSTASMMMITAAGVLTHNLYKPLLPKFSETHYVIVGRIAGGIVLVGGVLLATWFDNILQMLKFLWEFNAILAAAFWCGMKWRGANRIGAWSSMVVTMLLFAVIPAVLPVVYPGLRSNRFLLKQTEPAAMARTYTAREMDIKEREKEIERWEELKQQGKTQDLRPEQISAGQEVTKVFQPPRMSVFWSKDIKEKDGIAKGDGLLYVEMIAVDRLFDLSKNSYALNETIRTLIRILVPFSVLILISLLTRKDDAKLINRFYVKMRTPVHVDRQVDKMEMEKSYSNPERFKERVLFPNLGLEFFKWKWGDTLGFFLIVLGVFGIIGLLYLLLNIK